MTTEPIRLYAPAPPMTPSQPDGSHAASLRTRTTAELADLLDSPPAVELTSACTHALEAAALLLDVGPGDEVVVPAFAFPSTANAFLLRGATIRFADVDPATGNIDVASVERATSRHTRAVVCVHYGGVACDLEALAGAASRAGWHLVEDAAHGLFGSYLGTPLGRFGTLAGLSFHRTKNLTSFDGGALVVNDESLVDRSRVALDKGTNRVEFEHGRVTDYEWSGLGSAWRMSDPLVAVLAGQLERRDRIQSRRHEVWATYARELDAWAERVGARLPHVPDGAAHPAHLFWVVLPQGWDRGELAGWCGDRGVEVARHFGSLPESRYGASIAHPEDKCPEAQAFAERLVRLPLHHLLGDDDVQRVIDAVTSFGGAGAAR